MSKTQVENMPQCIPINTLIKWLAGSILSLLFISIVSFFFHDSISPWVKNPRLNKYVHPEGLVYRMRSQGWGNTIVGKYGINGIADITKKSENKIMIWGDSHVEAWHVDDSYKMPQVLTNILKLNSYHNYISVGIGNSGDSMVDFFLRYLSMKTSFQKLKYI